MLGSIVTVEITSTITRKFKETSVFIEWQNNELGISQQQLRETRFCGLLTYEYLYVTQIFAYQAKYWLLMLQIHGETLEDISIFYSFPG